MDKYTKKHIELVKDAKTDEELGKIINKIYEDGFQDGRNSENQTGQKEPPFDWHELD